MASNSNVISAMRVTVCGQIPFGQVGVTEENLENSTIGMKPSSIFLCVPKKETGTTPATIIEIIHMKRLIYFQLTTSADSAIVDPTGKILVVRTGITAMMSYDMGSVLPDINNIPQNGSMTDEPLRINAYLTPSKTWTSKLDFLFWKWISVDKIVFVTRDAVFHSKYLLDGSMSEALKIFDRDSSMKIYEVVDYIMEPNEELHLLIGRRRNEGDGLVTGRMQLYCARDRQLCRVIPEGQAAAFTRFKGKGNTEFSTLLCYGFKDGRKGKLFIQEIGPPDGNHLFGTKDFDIDFDSNEAVKGDFLIGIEINPNYGIIHVVTKFGDLHLYDLVSGVCLHCYQYGAGKLNQTVKRPINMLFTIPHQGGCLGVSREGVIFIFAVHDEHVIDSIRTNLSNPVLAVDLALRNNWHGADDLILDKFNTLMQEGNFTQAIEVAVKSPNGILRTKDTIQRLRQADKDRKVIHFVKAYFAYLLDNFVQLNDIEKKEKKLLDDRIRHKEYQTQRRHHKPKHFPQQ